MVWVAVTNSSSCTIYQYDKKSKKLNIINELVHPASRLKGSDLVSDKPGHYGTSGLARGAYSSHVAPKEHEIENFSKEISQILNEGRKTNEYEKLIVVASPHMNGLVYEQLDKQTQESTDTINKDYTHLKPNEIFDKLKEETQFPGLVGKKSKL